MDIPVNVREEVLNLIPASVYQNLACFVFYDNHPKDDKKLDISICTKEGDIKEYFKRDLVSSICLPNGQKPTDIKITRNSNLELYYAVTTQDNLFIISSKDTLQIHKIINNVCKYEIVDTLCSGKSSLKVSINDDAVPVIYDNNFESLGEGIITCPEKDAYSVITQLQQKLVEAKYNTKSNEQKLREYLHLRHNATLSMNQNLHSNLECSMFKDDLNNITGSLRLKSLKPHVTVCNNKLLIVVDVANVSEEPLEEVHILLNTATSSSLVYSTKLFTKLQTSPYNQEKSSNTLRPKEETTLVAVLNLEEVKYNVTSRIELAGCVYYKRAANEFLLPFEDVVVSSLECMGDKFDALSSTNSDDHLLLLSILSSTQKTELILRHIKSKDDPDISLQELFCKHLQMERIANNVIVYKKSPYHVLNGIMVVFQETFIDTAVTVCIYSRTPSQVLALLNCINDAVPTNIVATTINYNIVAKTDKHSQYSEENEQEEKYNFEEYAKSMLKRTTTVLEYLDNSMIRMSESKNPLVLSKIGSEINLFAGGIENFVLFKNNLLEETKKGIDGLLNANHSDSESVESDIIMVD